MRRADSRNARVVTTAAAVIAAVVLTGAQKSCDTQLSSSTSGSKASSKASSKADTNASSASTSSVRYSVTSDASIRSVTYINSDGDKVTRSNVGRTWSGSGPGGGRVMVQATLGDGSWIKCSVKANNKVVQRASATGGGSVTVVCDTTY
jgi:hypothetical protein